MSSYKCSYCKCDNNEKTVGVKKFHFPVNNPNVCQKWIKRSGSCSIYYWVLSEGNFFVIEGLKTGTNKFFNGMVIAEVI